MECNDVIVTVSSREVFLCCWSEKYNKICIYIKQQKIYIYINI